MGELLFEIGTEELPSWYVTQAKEALAEGAAQALKDAQLSYDSLSTYATPRRLALQVRGLAARSTERMDMRRGPSAEVAFDAEGKPTKAAIGFARGSGVQPEDLSVQETAKGRYVFAQLTQGGEAAKDVLPPLLADLVRALPAPRKMRWADITTPFVRPVAWLVALLDDEVLPVEVAGQWAGSKTRGHRFLSQGCLNLPRPEVYLEVLKDAWVLADPAVRREQTWQAVQQAAQTQGLTPVHDEALLDEVANLVEWPFAVLGHFDENYLQLPDEVLSTTMIHHQRFFPTRDAQGKLEPYFVSVSNNRVPDEAVIRRGYEEVLAGRLYDARFFWEADRQQTLSEHARALSGIAFQKGLGSMTDKVSRVSVTARLLAEQLELSTNETEILAQALPVYRADLSTQMVNEHPELEGVMARAYALAEGYSPEVAAVLEHGVRPTSAGGALPTSRVGALLSVADRVDKLTGFFALGKRPSGSADPFGLRRDGIAVARILNAQGWPLRVDEVVAAAAQSYQGDVEVDARVQQDVVSFIWDRVTGLLAEEAIRPELMRAAVADNPPVILAARRCHLLQAMSQEDEFPVLLALYKRAANLAKQADEDNELEPELFSDPHEAPLFEALPGARKAITELMSTAREVLAPWDLGRGPAQRLSGLDGTIARVLALKAPLDAFLDHVLVMVEDDALRRNRLALLREVRDALRELGALEELEGVAA